MSTPGEILIGDAVVPRTDPSHDVMTVYDVEHGGALCNWLVGTKMFSRREPLSNLIKLRRLRPRKPA